jgi:signal transduction histidine kinase
MSLLGGVLLVVSLGLWLGLWMSRRVIAPITQLADRVKGLNPEDFPGNLPEKFYDDETRVLAVALTDSMSRVNAFVAREKQFTRDASHELRTPVTVIRGAVEIMASSPCARDMENILESLLWMARHEAVDGSRQVCRPVAIIKEVLEQQRLLFRAKPVAVEYIAEDDPELEAPPAILKIVVTNLLQNAFRYTVEGKISVQTFADRVIIADTGVGIDDYEMTTITEPHRRGCRSCGFGLGLAIVKRLCRQCGWQFTIDSEPGRGTVVKLLFSPS